MKNLSEPHYFVYMARCADQSLYTGITVDVEKREAVHNSGKGAKYTRSRLPVKIVYKEEVKTKGEALKRELAIKKLTKKQKEELIKKA